MAAADNILIIINTGPDKRNNHYAAYNMAWVIRRYYKAKKVTIMYGPQAIAMTKKGNLASFVITPQLKKLTADQFDGLKAEKLPDHLEQLARFEKDKMDIDIVSCGTFHVVEGFGSAIKGTSDRC